MIDRLSDIEKYKRGELTPAEMHELERKALSDPFLADALEGVQSISSSELSSDLADIQQRLRAKGKKTIWFTPLRIAAGVLVLVGASYLVYTTFPEGESNAITQSTGSSSENKVQADSLAKQAEPTEKSQLLSLNKPAEETKPVPDAPKGPPRVQSRVLQQPPVDLTQSQGGLAALREGDKDVKEKADSTVIAEVQIADADEKDKVGEEAKPEAEKEKVIPVQEEKKDFSRPDFILSESRARKKESVASGAAADRSQEKVISGKVISAEDGQPLPGVNVVMKGTTIGTITDIYGYYSLPVNTENPQLVFSFIGMQTQEKETDKLTLDVQLAEDVSQLSEVVVAGRALSGQRDDALAAEPVIKMAAPVGGLRAYNNYLENNLRYPQEALENNIKGKVTVQFTVKTDGTLEEFNVLKGIGHGCDDEVIRLVKEGPKWNPTTQDDVAVESEVKVKMKFDPEKNKK